MQYLDKTEGEIKPFPLPQPHLDPLAKQNYA
jgi:hypothetical protein